MYYVTQYIIFLFQMLYKTVEHLNTCEHLNTLNIYHLSNNKTLQAKLSEIYFNKECLNIRFRNVF